MARLFVLIALLLAPLPGWAADGPIPVKVVVLTAFEIGADSGDAPGEFQAWVERYPLTRTMTVPGVVHPVRLSDDGVLGVVTGEFGRARSSIASLIADPRFDLSRAYWVLAGIGGVDPAAGSIGSAAWADWVVDGDPLFEIDDREAPAGWPWGLYAFGAETPGQKGRADDFSSMVWRLDPGLVGWAYGLTRDIALPDTPQLAAARAGFPSEPAARAPPHVFVGASLGSVRFWHGDRRIAWARDWIRTWTDGQARLAMTAGEEQALMDTLGVNAAGGRVDPRRVLVLRTASNYAREGDGQPQAVRFAPGGAEAAFEAAWRVASPVVRALVAGWDTYAETLPQAAP